MKLDIETEQLIASIKLDLLEKTLPQCGDFDLVTEAAHISTMNAGSGVRLNALYTLTDKVMKFVANFTPCKEGCADCCHYPVGISNVEIKYIEENTNKQRHPSITGVTRKDRLPLGKPCPFLNDNGGCDIYPYRPYACRRHLTISLDSHWCHHQRVASVKMPIIRFELLDNAWQSIIEDSGHHVLHEIRDVFSK